MGLCSLMTRRNGIYSFRKRVPDDLQQVLGKKTIKKSLKTNNPNQAKQLKAKLEAEIMELFASKRAEIKGETYTPLRIESPLSTATQTGQLNATPKGKNHTIQQILDLWSDSKRGSSRNSGKAEVSVQRSQQKLDKFISLLGDLFIGDLNVP